jgi:hypothetical protein
MADHKIAVIFTGECYDSYGDYGVGSTENCDNDLFGAFKDKDGYVACSEVEAYQVLVTRYREKKDVKQEVQTV